MGDRKRYCASNTETYFAVAVVENHLVTETLAGVNKYNLDNQLTFTTPEKAGEYRLFVYVYVQHGKVESANITFLVNH